MDSNQLRTGHKVMVNGEPHEVVDYTLRQQPRLAAKMITKMRNLLTGNTVEKTFTSGEDVPTADIEVRKASFLYSSGDEYSFMDDLNFEQFEFGNSILGGKAKFLKDGMEVFIMFWEGRPISIQLAPTVVLEVSETEPGVRGDTATGGTKTATLETGISVRVPLFVNIGDRIVVNTETGEYKERAKD
ncbi:MAG: elongation factor P [Candidatus Peregrinibacteria bacterium]